MANPENVKTSQSFYLKDIILSENGFSIGIGSYLGSDELVLAMRWDGNEESAGFPYAGKHPLWFTLPKGSLSVSFLNGLLQDSTISKNTAKKINEYLKK